MRVVAGILCALVSMAFAAEDKRIIAYVPNWDVCPDTTAMSQYTHAMVAFAVTYRYAGNADNCAAGSLGEQCVIQPLDGCKGVDGKAKTFEQMAADLKAAGLKTIVSFGGAGFGGTWYPRDENTSSFGRKVDHCWHHCHGKVDSLVASLETIVTDNDLDGLDIDYEYFLDTPEDYEFLEDLSVKLYDAMNPKGVAVTHAPMDIDACDQFNPPQADDGDILDIYADLLAESPNEKPWKVWNVAVATAPKRCRPMYFNILKDNSAKVDYVMVQYYNQLINPKTNSTAAVSHYKALVDGAFGGDGSKVVFGVCNWKNDDCPTANGTVTLFQEVAEAVPDFGGMMFWDARKDQLGWWSLPVAQYFECELDATALGKQICPPTPPADASSTGPIGNTTADPTADPEASGAFFPSLSLNRAPFLLAVCGLFHIVQ